MPPGARLSRRLPAALMTEASRASEPGAEMCGIAGCYQQADGQKLVDIMTDRIAHRGPDAAGIWSHEDDRVAAQLGHRRLSIIDLSAAADQPLSKDGMTLVYNGELYNYQELRASWSLAAFVSSPNLTRRSSSRHGGHGDRRPCAASAACSRSHCSTSAPAISSWRVTRSASSRCTTFPRRWRGIRLGAEGADGSGGPELRIELGALVASMLYYWVPEQRCAIDGVQKLPRGSWASFRPDGVPRSSTTGVSRTWRRRPRPGRLPTWAR